LTPKAYGKAFQRVEQSPDAIMYSFYLSVLPAEQASSELQNKISLYLME